MAQLVVALILPILMVRPVTKRKARSRCTAGFLKVLLKQELLAHIPRALAPVFALRLGCSLRVGSFRPTAAQHFVQSHQVLQLLGLHLHLRLLGCEQRALCL